MKIRLAVWPVPIVLGLALCVLGFASVNPWGGCPVRKTARVAASIAHLVTLADGIAVWHDDTGAYPAPCQGPRVPLDMAVLGSDFTRRKRGLTDGWGNEFRYASTGTHFVLYSYGPDGRADESYARFLLLPSTDARGMCQVAIAAHSDDLVVFDGLRCRNVAGTKPSARDSP